MLRFHVVHVLEDARIAIFWVPREIQDADVDWNGEERDEAYYVHPVSDPIGTLGDIAAPMLLHKLQLDRDLEQIRQEREEGSKGEGHSEEGNKAHLNDSFVVVEDVRCG